MVDMRMSMGSWEGVGKLKGLECNYQSRYLQEHPWNLREFEISALGYLQILQQACLSPPT